MATNIRLAGDIASVQPVEDHDSNQDSEMSKDKDETTKTVPLYKLFSFADPSDRLLMLMGTVGAIGNGLSMPLMILIFGTMINAFGDSTNSKVVDKVSEVIYSLIFNGFSLSLPSGTTAALVGQSGSGKSTVVSLIERFYDPTDGEVVIDGINLREFQLKWIRQKIGLGTRSVYL